MNPPALSSPPPSTLTPSSSGGSLLAADPHRGPVVQAPFLDVVNINPAFRSHYAGDERLARTKQAANDQRELDGRRQHCLDHATARQQRGGSGGDIVDATGREQQQGNNEEAVRRRPPIGDPVVETMMERLDAAGRLDVVREKKSEELFLGCGCSEREEKWRNFFLDATERRTLQQ
ncbi:hypothetical protein LR48_Vigan252s002400 [Vigna angularis]|uniref:Uncharacterized protein n=1 Tax=Phaseolus angularis TaxID=3914 RepID=A0A0L9T6V2_PHAAN|nr:hypothetical protein LR48_Vigan252s002400 [Vigna angularis]